MTTNEKKKKKPKHKATQNDSEQNDMSQTEKDRVNQKILDAQKQKQLEEEITKRVDASYNEKLKDVQNTVNMNDLEGSPAMKKLFFTLLGALQENRNIAKDKLLMQNKLDTMQGKLETSLHSRSSLFKQISLLTEQTKKQDEFIQRLVAENKSILDQHEKSNEQEHSRREDIQKGFQAAIDDIHVKLNEQGNERLKTQKENELLTIQAETMIKQMELREKQFEAELRKAQLEKELVRHKMEEKLKDSESGEQKVLKMKKKLELKSHEVNEYKKQLNQYSTKYIEIQKTIKDSNKTFDQIRNELARLKTKNEQLEKEKSELKKMVQEARMTGISSPKFVPSRDLSTISTQSQPRGRTPETPKNDEMIDIAATPKTIIDIQTPVIFSPSRVNEEVRANASLLHPTVEEDLNEVDL